MIEALQQSEILPSPFLMNGFFCGVIEDQQQTKGLTMAEEEIKLIAPTEALRDIYMDFLADFARAGETQIDGAGGDAEDDFAAFVQQQEDYTRGVDLPDGWVPASTFWVVCKNEILGVCNIRHRLIEKLRDFGGHIGYSIRPSQRNKGYGTLMLKLALEKAREVGIDRVLITCDKDNIASQRVILKNGGVMDSESYSEQAGRITQRYWIELTVEGRGQ
ncbi:hypothetical protein LCGC14_3029900 [marine sediment metagenome]|uniref:N-acetyltransferase domain-containing protein n=1 Tax=marine sediment metagenome TaxID=412755 RepID=A0A0F8XG06_9ZZZZ